MGEGPLQGLRVVDLTDDRGRFATKLLAEGGASVVRLGRGSPGPPIGRPAADRRGGLLEWWYDGAKSVVATDLDTEAGRSAYVELARRADLIVETEAPGRLAALGIDHPDLVGRLGADPGLVQVSVTPFGRTGPRRDWCTSDLVSAALGGVLSVCGTPEQPQAMWGRQSYNVAGFLAAISGLAAVHHARRAGVGQLVDVSIHEAVATTVEQLLYQYWFDDVLPYPKVAPRQGSMHWSRAYKVVPAREGWVMITPTPDFAGLVRWMVESGWAPATEYLGLEPMDLLGKIDGFMDCVQAFAGTMDATSLFHGAQDRHIAFGLVQDVPTVASNPQHDYRGFFRWVDWSEDRLSVPGPFARFGGRPAGPPRPPSTARSLAEVLEEWTRPDPPPSEPGPGRPGRSAAATRPLDGIRVLDLSHVLAGPMGTRVLGDLGADVVKLQTAERATGVNDPAHPYFYIYNRSKRAIALDLQDPRAAAAIRGLVEASDVLIENFAAGVLDRLGLSYERVAAWNPRLIYVTMSGCGHEGPWSRLVTYAPTIHALAGVTHLCNPPGRSDIGPGFSLTDHVVGLSAATAVLAALLDRQSTGVGQHVDIAQMETGTYLIGPALLAHLADGTGAEPIGNRDPFGQLAPNEVYPTADGRWLAVTCRDDDDWGRLGRAAGLEAGAGLATVEDRLAALEQVDALVGQWAATVTAEAGQAVLQAAGVPAGAVQDAGDLMLDPQMVARQVWGELDHAVLGRRPHDRFPARWSVSRLEPYRVAPGYVGQHNFEVYGSLLGLDEADIATGMADGLFA